MEVKHSKLLRSCLLHGAQSGFDVAVQRKGVLAFFQTVFQLLFGFFALSCQKKVLGLKQDGVGAGGTDNDKSQMQEHRVCYEAVALDQVFDPALDKQISC